MQVEHWAVLDETQNLYFEELSIGPHEVGGRLSNFHIHKRRLHGGPREGVDVIDVDNGVFRFTVLPTRGMGLWKAELGQVKLGWQAPVRGPVHPRLVNLAEPSGLGWLAGFDELLCRCGLESNGGPDFDPQGRLRHTLHGRIANTLAHRVEIAVDFGQRELIVRGEVDESRLYGNKLRLATTIRTRIDEPGLRITDEVINLSAEPADLQLLYHTNFGAPLLEKGARVVAPARQVIAATQRAAEGIESWGDYLGPTSGYTEQVYFLELIGDTEGMGEALLRNAGGDQGVSLKFPLTELPYFTLWKSTQMPEDGYVTGLEPGVNLPNVKSFEQSQGRVIRLAPHERKTHHLQLEVHADRTSVAQCEQRLTRLQGPRGPELVARPQLPWAPSE
jgi:hypothetical protein